MYSKRIEAVNFITLADIIIAGVGCVSIFVEPKGSEVIDLTIHTGGC